MNYIKRSERFIKAANMFKTIRDAGGVVKEIAEYSKWHNLNEGSRIQVTLTIVKMVNMGNTAYILGIENGWYRVPTSSRTTWECLLLSLPPTSRS